MTSIFSLVLSFSLFAKETPSILSKAEIELALKDHRKGMDDYRDVSHRIAEMEECLRGNQTRYYIEFNSLDAENLLSTYRNLLKRANELENTISNADNLFHKKIKVQFKLNYIKEEKFLELLSNLERKNREKSEMNQTWILVVNKRKLGETTAEEHAESTALFDKIFKRFDEDAEKIHSDIFKLLFEE